MMEGEGKQRNLKRVRQPGSWWTRREKRDIGEGGYLIMEN